jgi:hypothetical protein
MRNVVENDTLATQNNIDPLHGLLGQSAVQRKGASHARCHPLTRTMTKRARPGHSAAPLPSQRMTLPAAAAPGSSDSAHRTTFQIHVGFCNFKFQISNFRTPKVTATADHRSADVTIAAGPTAFARACFIQKFKIQIWAFVDFGCLNERLKRPATARPVLIHWSVQLLLKGLNKSQQRECKCAP